MSFQKGLVAVVGMILACGMGAVAAFGQQPQVQTAPGQDSNRRMEREQRMQERRERIERREGPAGERRMHRRGGLGRFARELNLTDEQRQQQRAIIERQLASTKVQREELQQLGEKRRAGTFTADDEARAKALHQQLRSSMEGIRAQMDAVLTAEQKAKLEELKAERKQRMEQRRKKFCE